MITGFKASNGRSRLDVRDQIERLQLDLRAETESEAKALAVIRQRFSDAMANDQRWILVGTSPDDTQEATTMTIRFEKKPF